uniref:DNA repair protein RAD51 homolog 3 n=1 Tax=Polytomella parva TaxID=51329 RepID=A0A7S0VAH7_9CHLO|mmetsp:Transcript_29024/g.53337  ORF Transcript_29024/g.53337 Transcript_29024/m.53337 type:complete len:488 (+) Transcript_29024:392-1855(+)|eukprot:CAMPEP_0175052176 /NCGR_PEP_ID=MMETSP0052_2-20121109/8216_1 /TAXON_ID=51329 ORGANISM="Polytomella parva, Strain SAG 63-3" /NCGR_SAMPLE_ID=MMETSP0052_2 /ASSEMBLY_ACC=CAM_ASM_000194 /LENGTH=487 /DNA_ID=CAMNT_0016316555 /DNA_START=306 /DNA_END=1769 /DNA_ORIENTATION=+
MSDREISTLPLPPTLRSQLSAAGFSKISDFNNIGPIALSKEVGISPADAREVLDLAKGSHIVNNGVLRVSNLDGQCAGALYRSQRAAPKIVSFCEDVDRMLGGGFALGNVYELCGAPGVGKTQFGIQLTVDAQIPTVFGGVEGQSIFVDTEGSFMSERAREIAAAAAGHIRALAERFPLLNPDSLATSSKEHLGQRAREVAREFTEDKILENILYFRLHDHVEQIAFVKILSDFLDLNPRVRLLVIDSVSFLLRQCFPDLAHRARVLMQMAQELMRVAETKNIAIVLINQVTTRIMKGDDTPVSRNMGMGSSSSMSHANISHTNNNASFENNALSHVSKLVPSLGESWGHAASWRVVLRWENGVRHAVLIKSPFMPPASVPYTISRDGIRSIPSHVSSDGEGMAHRSDRTTIDSTCVVLNRNDNDNNHSIVNRNDGNRVVIRNDNDITKKANSIISSSIEGLLGKRKDFEDEDEWEREVIQRNTRIG